MGNIMAKNILTKAQQKIMDELDRGLRPHEVANNLGLHESSIRAQIKRIMKKQPKILLEWMERK